LFGTMVTVLVAGCGSGPSQVGSAVIVGKTAVPVSQVRDALQWQLDNVPRVRQLQDSGNLPQVSRQLVRRRVVHQLLDVATERAGVRADEDAVSELIESVGGQGAVSEQAGIAPQRVRRLATDQVLLRELGKHYVPRLTISFVGGIITPRGASGAAEDAARELAEKIAAHPDRAGTLLQRTDKSVHKENFALSDAVRQAPELSTSALYGASPGTVLVIQPTRSRGSWMVALVRDRTIDASAAGAAAGNVDARLMTQVGLRMLQPVAADLGVKINPRYGVWDATAMDIAPSEQEVAGYQFRSRTVRS